jgi:hypothetical protein
LSKRICPSCGSRYTAKILWGEPAMSLELAEKLENREIVLRGCCMPVPHPTHHCTSCEKDFGGSYFAEPTCIKELYFYVGGYFGPSHRVYCNTEESGKLLSYEGFPGNDGYIGRTTDWLNHVSLEDRWEEFNADLLRCYIIDWKETYEIEACDGTQWELTVTFDNGTTIHRHGSNDFPPHWNKLLRLFSKYGLRGIS